MKNNYIHTPLPEFTASLHKEGDVLVRNFENRSFSYITDITLTTYLIANKISIQKAKPFQKYYLPHHSDNDNLIFAAPLCSSILNRKVTFMRGWKRFESCIKGFNALGLMAEQVLLVQKNIKSLSSTAYLNLIKDYLKSRKNKKGESIFQEEELNNIAKEKLLKIDALDIALWVAFGTRTIVCSTSSNMGISLHDALREMQNTPLAFLDKTYTLLNDDEGDLIIWCPGEEADFMNNEKTTFLRKLEAESPPLTKLRPYINRTQRDPGALRDALIKGGYFFPTNPQGVDEIQNLLFFALKEMAAERNQSIAELCKDENIQFTLQSLKCEIENDKIYVTDGVEGGISGLMLPYFLMVEELISQNKIKALSTWNQASIGAALAAAIIADKILRNPEVLNEKTRSDLFSQFPAISKFLDSKTFGKDIKTRVHGVFDLANIQSLAQLLGVVVEKHLSGRGTAFVGLGSSSYSNGNRCYEIMKDSFENEESFRGKSTFHPSTHTLNPFAQAIVYGEDLFRCVNDELFINLNETDKIEFIGKHIRKPEPAGAAAMAGYLLSRLDSGTFSIIELAYLLRILGFNKKRFLEFINHSPDDSGYNLFIQEAAQEGVYMESLAKNILTFLEWPVMELEEKATIEHEHSKLKYNLYPLDDQRIDSLNPTINIYMTGDNTFQPDKKFIEKVLRSQQEHMTRLNSLKERSRQKIKKSNMRMIRNTSSLFVSISDVLKNLDKKVNTLMKKTMNKMVDKKVNDLTNK